MQTRPMTDRERRLLRWGGWGLGIYLLAFLGFKGWREAERTRLDYRRLAEEARLWETRLQLSEDRAAMARKWMEQFRFDPAKLSRTTLVAQASAAIQQSAMQGGVQLGAIRETPNREGGRTLSTIQLEGMGPPPAVLRFLQGLGSVGFPIVTESVQVTGAGMMPGPVKINVTLLLLDFETWKPGEGRPDA